jgi:hypothetical protein
VEAQAGPPVITVTEGMLDQGRDVPITNRRVHHLCRCRRRAGDAGLASSDIGCGAGLRAHHLDTFYASITSGRRGRPLSPATIRRIHAVLRSALGSAVKRRLIPYNPAEHIELAPANPKRPRLPSARPAPSQTGRAQRPWSRPQGNVAQAPTMP